MRHPFRLTLLALCSLAVGAAHAADPITMDVSAALEGFSPERGTVPVAVELRNEGPDARGVLRVTGDDFQMDYPVELPRGSEKRLITYPTLGYGGARYMLLTNQGRVLRAYEPPGGFTVGASSVLLISDNAGELAFLRSNTGANRKEQQQGLQDSYCRPGLSPTRAIGYVGLNAVALGAGAERMTDDEVAALKSWTLTGGTLIFMGGASAPVLGDPRWRDLLPVEKVQPRTLTSSSVLERLGGSPAPSVTVLSGQPIAGVITRTERDVLVTAERGFGLGRTVYLAFNPLEPPLTGWSGRRTAMMRIVRPTDVQRARTFLQAYSQNNEDATAMPTAYTTRTVTTPTTTTTTGYHSGGPPTGLTGRAPGMPDAQDPFSTTLPPAERVLKILGAYFLVVVPLNFLVLRKLKRGELAWFTAPVISLGFAGALFTSAQSLYSAKMSTATVGIVVGQQGMTDGMFVGMTQIFIPRSGVYDLKLTGVENLGTPRTDTNFWESNGEDTAQFDPVDVGEIQVPAMRANNLAFRRMNYRQRMPVGEWFSIDVEPTGNGKWRCTARNSGSYPLSAAKISVGSADHELGTLEPGQARTVTVDRPVGGADPGITWDVDQFLYRQNGVALVGTLDGVRPGPQLGQVVADRTKVNLVFFAKEALGKS
ncbi:MAG: hypothetical protein ACO1SV_12620 [Fimbriimonas sp.]